MKTEGINLSRIEGGRGYFLFSSGILVRTLLLGPVFYGDLILQRLIDFSKEFSPHYKRMETISKTSKPNIQKILEYTKIKQISKQLRKKHKISVLRFLISFSALPLGLFSMFLVQRLAIRDSTEHCASTKRHIWANRDDTFMLPLLAESLYVFQANISLSIIFKRDPIFFQRYIKPLRRLSVSLPLIALPVVAQFSAGLCVFNIGMGVAGLIQPIILIRKLSQVRRMNI